MFHPLNNHAGYPFHSTVFCFGKSFSGLLKEVVNYYEGIKLLRHPGALWQCTEAGRSGVKRSGTHGVVTPGKTG